jgi:hypothetical protein
VTSDLAVQLTNRVAAQRFLHTATVLALKLLKIPCDIQ